MLQADGRAGGTSGETGAYKHGRGVTSVSWIWEQ